MSMFLELKQALEEVRDYRAGRRTDLRVIRFKPPKSALVRSPGFASLCGFSRREFALLLNTNAGTVQSWEQGTRRPQGTALLLLAMAKTNPAAL